MTTNGKDGPLNRQSVVYDMVHKALPVAFFLHFVITGTVVLVYTLYLHQPVPASYTSGAAIAFGCIIALTLAGCLVIYRRKQKRNYHDLEIESRLGSGQSKKNWVIKLIGFLIERLVKFNDFSMAYESRRLQHVREFVETGAQTRLERRKTCVAATARNEYGQPATTSERQMFAGPERQIQVTSPETAGSDSPTPDFDRAFASTPCSDVVGSPSTATPANANRSTLAPRDVSNGRPIDEIMGDRRVENHRSTMGPEADFGMSFPSRHLSPQLSAINLRQVQHEAEILADEFRSEPVSKRLYSKPAPRKNNYKPYKPSLPLNLPSNLTSNLQ